MFHWHIYFLKQVCMGFVGLFLSTSLLLKTIDSMKRYYVGVLEYIGKWVNFAYVLFKSVFF